MDMKAGTLAFTWCQVPVVYQLDNDAEPSLTVTLADGEKQTMQEMALLSETSAELFRRSGHVRQIDVKVIADQLFAE